MGMEIVCQTLIKTAIDSSRRILSRFIPFFPACRITFSPLLSYRISYMQYSSEKEGYFSLIEKKTSLIFEVAYLETFVTKTKSVHVLFYFFHMRQKFSTRDKKFRPATKIFDPRQKPATIRFSLFYLFLWTRDKLGSYIRFSSSHKEYTSSCIVVDIRPYTRFHVSVFLCTLLHKMHCFGIYPRATARSAFRASARDEGNNSVRLFTPGKRRAWRSRKSFRRHFGSW